MTPCTEPCSLLLPQVYVAARELLPSAFSFDPKDGLVSISELVLTFPTMLYLLECRSASDPKDKLPSAVR